ncbi:MAG: FecR domain-containing protein [Acidobacteriia bacterium]|nr:FecR domain-containing protein [Terriglobia bacterium]
MKCSCFFRAVLLAAASLTFFLIPATHAQDSDYARVVRLSRTEGQVLVSHSGSDMWEEALVNLPLQEGDTLATQSGFAEIEFESGATAYLAENSVLQFTQLAFSEGGRLTQLMLTQGAGTFYANLTRQDSFRVLTPTFEVAIPERADVRVDTFRDGASVQVLQGNVSVSTSAGSTDLEKGQSVAIHEGDFQHLNIARLPNPDSFDQWVTEESEIIRAGNKDTLSYINSPNYYGLSDLSIYGTWANVPGYGNSWRPFNVGFSWTPYFNGKWILDPLLGWIWVSNEPWGWMPYHFGTWLLSPTLGWVWIPGGPAGLRQWQPARVNWVHVGNQVGWVAMSPKDRDGTPANVAQGVITKPSQSPRNGNGSNEILSGKGLRSVTPLKQPPQEISSQPGPGTSGSGIHSTIRIAPWTLNNNQSIVFDHRTHTFINRDGRDGRDGRTGNGAGNGSNPPVAPAVQMPPFNAQTEIPRVTLPPPAPADSQIKRVILPPPYPAALAPQRNVPITGTAPARLPTSMPANTQPHPIAPPPAPSPSPAPHTRPAQMGSAAHSATQTPQFSSHPVPTGRH